VLAQNGQGMHVKVSNIGHRFWIDVPYWLMTQRAAYLRDQADKLQWHAAQIRDAETKEQLRKLAVEYIERAALAEIEDKE
jgi:hypothetical protein